MDHPVANPVPREMLDHKTKPMDTRFGYSHDDIISFNTQCSSQWDGLRRSLEVISDYRSLGSPAHTTVL